jgi:NDP-sugar pyrophosphorylase family protein
MVIQKQGQSPFYEGKWVSVSVFPGKGFPDVFIHPTAIIDGNVKIGKGTKIWHFSHILSGSKIGENCNIGQIVVNTIYIYVPAFLPQTRLKPDFWLAGQRRPCSKTERSVCHK